MFILNGRGRRRRVRSCHKSGLADIRKRRTRRLLCHSVISQNGIARHWLFMNRGLQVIWMQVALHCRCSVMLRLGLWCVRSWSTIVEELVQKAIELLIVVCARQPEDIRVREVDISISDGPFVQWSIKYVEVVLPIAVVVISSIEAVCDFSRNFPHALPLALPLSSDNGFTHPRPQQLPRPAMIPTSSWRTIHLSLRILNGYPPIPHKLSLHLQSSKQALPCCSLPIQPSSII